MIKQLFNLVFIALLSTATVFACPTATITYSGSLCDGSTVTLHANTGGVTSYQWCLNSIPISGATFSTYDAATPGKYTVKENIGGCNITSAPVTLNTLPAARLIQPAGSCLGSSTVALAIGPDYRVPQVLDPLSATALQEYIENFSFNTLVNNGTGSSNNISNYSFKRSSGTQVMPGSTYNFSIESPGFNDPMGYAIWIDYDQNGSFDDAGELAFSMPPTNGVVDSVITIPSTAILGATHMRVRLGSNQWFVDGDADVAADMGETEDYIITIGRSTAVTYAWSSTPSGFVSVEPFPALSPGPDTTYHLTINDSASGCSRMSSVLVNSGTIYPFAYADSVWNAYVYDGINFDTYVGYYVEPHLSFSSADRWDSLASPSDAPGYKGCPAGYDNHSVKYKRKGFPCGTYSLDIPKFSEVTALYINDSLVFQDLTCCHADTGIWTGFLDSHSKIEYNWKATSGQSTGSLTLNLIAAVAVTSAVNGSTVTCPGTIGVTYSVNEVPGATSYMWSLPSGATIAAGTNTNTITVDFAPNAASGNVSVYGINTCGASTVSSMAVAVDSLPTTTLHASGSPVICAGSTLGISAQHANTYLWSTGATTSSIATTTAGRYSATLFTGAGCTIKSDTVSVTVNPLPSVNISSINKMGICNQEITLAGGWPSGGTYSGTGVTSGKFYPSSGAGSHTITYSYTNNNGCSNTATTNIIVDPLPTVSLGTLSNIGVCNNAISLASGTPSGGIYSGAGVSGSTFNPAIGEGTYTIAYTYNDANGCPNTATKNITVDALPEVNAGTYASVGICNQAIELTNATPNGGTFSGTGVSNGMFDPSLGAGTHTISYTYTDTHGCSNTANTDIIVDATPDVTVGPFATFGECNHPVLLTAGSPYGGIYSGTGVNSALSRFDPSVGPGTYTITYQYTDAHGCGNSSTSEITVDSRPAVSAGTYPTIGACNTGLRLNGTPAGGTFSGNGVVNGIFTPFSGDNTYTVNYNYMDDHGCTTVAKTDITVDPLPVVDAGADLLALDCAEPFFITGGIPAGGFFSGQGVSNGWFDPSNGPGLYTVSYYYADANGCHNADIRIFTVNLCTGLKTMDDETSAVSVYPNPSHDVITVEVNSASQEIKSLMVSDIAGKEIMTRENFNVEKITLNVSSLAKGLYFIRVQTNDNSFVRKITIE